MSTILANSLVSMKSRDVLAVMCRMLWVTSKVKRDRVRDLSADPAEIGNPVDIRDTADPAITRKFLKGKRNIIRYRNLFSRTCDSVGAVSSSLSGAAPRAAPRKDEPSPPVIPLRFARFSSRLAFLISTCCSSRRRLSSSGLNVPFALNCVRRCSGM
jgi:hypothetical protein